MVSAFRCRALVIISQTAALQTDFISCRGMDMPLRDGWRDHFCISSWPGAGWRFGTLRQYAWFCAFRAWTGYSVLAVCS